MGKIILFAAIGLLSMAANAIGYNYVPASWLCDYGEEADAERRSHRRIGVVVFGILCALSIFCAVALFRSGKPIRSVIGLLISAEWLMLGAWADIRYTVLPDQIAIGVAAIGLLLRGIAVPSEGVWTLADGAIGAVIGGGVLALIGLIGARVTGAEETMGMGDVKLLAAIGVSLGIRGMIYGYILLLLTAGLSFGVLMAIGRLHRGDYRPLGPFIALSAIAVWVFEPVLDRAVAWYLSLLA